MQRTLRYVQGELPKLTMGERMAKLRNDAGMSRADMAEMQTVSLGTISNWEHDRNGEAPKLPALLVYADLRPDLDRSAVLRWIKYGEVDLSDQDGRNSWCNSVEQLDLFSEIPLAADVRIGGAVWEFSGRLSESTSTSAEDVANGLGRQLVA